MTPSPIELTIPAGGPLRTDANGAAQPGAFAGLLFAHATGNAAGEPDQTADPLAQLAALLGVPITPGSVLPGDPDHPALMAFLQATVNAQSTGGDATAGTFSASPGTPPGTLPGTLPDGLLAALNRLSGAGQAPPQDSGPVVPANPAGPAGQIVPPTAAPAPAGEPAAVAPPTRVPASALSAAAPGSETAPPSLLPTGADTAGPAATGSAPARPAVQQTLTKPEPSPVEAARPTAKPAVNSSHAPSSLPVQAQVAASGPSAPAQAAAPLSPETAAAVLTSHEQAQIAAQSGAQPAGPALNAKPALGQVTRDERKLSQSPRSQPNAAAGTNPSAQPGTRPANPAGTAPAASNPLTQPTAPMAPGMPIPQGEFAAFVPPDAPGQASLAATSTEPISGTGLQSESQRGNWRPMAPADQVAVHIKKAIGEGKDQVTVRLEPAKLGRIEVRLAASSDGTIRAAVVAELPGTLDLLQSDSRALERALQDAGLKTNSDSLSFNLRGEGQNGKFADQDQPGGSNQNGESGQTDGPAFGDEAASQRSRHDGTLDISV